VGCSRVMRRRYRPLTSEKDKEQLNFSWRFQLNADRPFAVRQFFNSLLAPRGSTGAGKSSSWDQRARFCSGNVAQPPPGCVRPKVEFPPVGGTQPRAAVPQLGKATPGECIFDGGGAEVRLPLNR